MIPSGDINMAQEWYFLDPEFTVAKLGVKLVLL
jgi:hypothetical protein